MNIAERLDAIRADFPECEAVVYADISTKTALSSSAETQLRQEHLNELCNTAVDLLGGPATEHLARIWADSESAHPGVYQAIILEKSELGIFLRSTANPMDALCCVCAASTNITAFISAARDQLEKIGQDK